MVGGTEICPQETLGSEWETESVTEAYTGLGCGQFPSCTPIGNPVYPIRDIKVLPPGENVSALERANSLADLCHDRCVDFLSVFEMPSGLASGIRHNRKTTSAKGKLCPGLN